MKNCFASSLSLHSCVFPGHPRAFRVWTWVPNFPFYTFRWEFYYFFLSFYVNPFPSPTTSSGSKPPPCLFGDSDFVMACLTLPVATSLSFHSLSFAFTAAYSFKTLLSTFTFVTHAQSFAAIQAYTNRYTFYEANWTFAHWSYRLFGSFEDSLACVFIKLPQVALLSGKRPR